MAEFRYTGSPLAALQGVDADGRVLYLGSFSKSMFAGLRLAYLVVPMDLIAAFRAARLPAGGPPPVLEQSALAAFMKEGRYTRHLRRSRKIHESGKPAWCGPCDSIWPSGSMLNLIRRGCTWSVGFRMG